MCDFLKKKVYIVAEFPQLDTSRFCVCSYNETEKDAKKYLKELTKYYPDNLYAILQVLDVVEKNEDDPYPMCECGNKLKIGDSFCPKCGRKRS